MQKNYLFFLTFILLALISSCSSICYRNVTNEDLESSLKQNCMHPIIKEVKYGMLPVKIQITLDNPKVRILKNDNKIYFDYQMKLSGLGLNLECNTCTFSTIPKIVNFQPNLSDNFTLEKADCIGGPDWLKSVLSTPQEFIMNAFAGNPYEIIQCSGKALPQKAEKFYIYQDGALIIE